MRTDLEGWRAFGVKTISADLVANGYAPGLCNFVRAMISSAGFAAVILYRVSAQTRTKGFAGRAFSRFVWRVNQIISSCDISPEAHIASGLRLPHPMGVVIGSGVIIGERVSIYQGATIGQIDANVAIYPTISSGATIYAGAVVAGSVAVGRNAVVGANSFVNCNVPDGAVAVGCPARLIHEVQ